MYILSGCPVDICARNMLLFKTPVSHYDSNLVRQLSLYMVSDMLVMSTLALRSSTFCVDKIISWKPSTVYWDGRHRRTYTDNWLGLLICSGPGTYNKERTVNLTRYQFFFNTKDLKELNFPVIHYADFVLPMGTSRRNSQLFIKRILSCQRGPLGRVPSLLRVIAWVQRFPGIFVWTNKLHSFRWTCESECSFSLNKRINATGIITGTC